MTEQPYLLNVEVSGSGPPLLLLHGMIGSSRYWQNVIPVLSRTHKVIGVDLLGFGKSPKPRQATYSLNQHTESIVKTLNHLSINGSLTVVTHSIGGVIGLHLAAAHPKLVKQLLLFGLPVYKNPQEARSHILKTRILPPYLLYGPLAHLTCKLVCQWGRPLTAKIVPRYLKGLPPDIAQDSLLHTWYSYSRTRQNILEEQNLHKDLKQVHCPVTIIYGQQDRWVIPANIKTLKKISQQLRVQAVSGSHQLPIENPQLILKNII